MLFSATCFRNYVFGEESHREEPFRSKYAGKPQMIFANSCNFAIGSEGYSSRLQLLPQNVRNIVDVAELSPNVTTALDCQFRLLRAGKVERNDFVTLPMLTVNSAGLEGGKVRHPELFVKSSTKAKTIGFFELWEIMPEVVSFLYRSEEIKLEEFYPVVDYEIMLGVEPEFLRNLYLQLLDPAMLDVLWK